MRRTGIAAVTAFVASIAIIGAGAPNAQAAVSPAAATTGTPTLLYCATVFEDLQPFAKASTALGSAGNTESVFLTALHGWSKKASSGAKKIAAVSAPEGTSAKVRSDVKNLASVLRTAASETKTIHTKAQLEHFLPTGKTMEKDVTTLTKACGF
jgi:hypothetical protein